MLDFVSHSSSYGRAIFHICFKAKYCCRVFEDRRIEQRCREVFYEVAVAHKISISDMGFGGDHVHMIVDVGLRGVSEITKLLKGTSAKILLREFPWLKNEYFWSGGFWSPATYFDSIGTNYDDISAYVNSQ
jgi:REP element-mobilizing transposase RayT